MASEYAELERLFNKVLCIIDRIDNGPEDEGIK